MKKMKHDILAAPDEKEFIGVAESLDDGKLKENWDEISIKRIHATEGQRMTIHKDGTITNNSIKHDDYNYLIKLSGTINNKKIVTTHNSTLIEAFVDYFADFFFDILPELESMKSDAFSYRLKQMFDEYKEETQHDNND